MNYLHRICFLLSSYRVLAICFTAENKQGEFQTKRKIMNLFFSEGRVVVLYCRENTNHVSWIIFSNDIAFTHTHTQNDNCERSFSKKRRYTNTNCNIRQKTEFIASRDLLNVDFTKTCIRKFAYLLIHFKPLRDKFPRKDETAQCRSCHAAMSSLGSIGNLLLWIPHVHTEQFHPVIYNAQQVSFAYCCLVGFFLEYSTHSPSHMVCLAPILQSRAISPAALKMFCFGNYTFSYHVADLWHRLAKGRYLAQVCKVNKHQMTFSQWLTNRKHVMNLKSDLLSSLWLLSTKLRFMKIAPTRLHRLRRSFRLVHLSLVQPVEMLLRRACNACKFANFDFQISDEILTASYRIISL